MDISFNCPHCDQHLAVDDGGSDKTGDGENLDEGF
jgi:hypothetical protein